MSYSLTLVFRSSSFSEGSLDASLLIYIEIRSPRRGRHFVQKHLILIHYIITGQYRFNELDPMSKLLSLQ